MADESRSVETNDKAAVSKPVAIQRGRQRLQTIRFHAEVAQAPKGWHAALKDASGGKLKPPTLSRITSRDHDNNYKRGADDDTCELLGRIDLPVFANILLKARLPGRGPAEGDPDTNTLTVKLLKATTQDDYAEACALLGIPIRQPWSPIGRDRAGKPPNPRVKRWRPSNFAGQRVPGAGGSTLGLLGEPDWPAGLVEAATPSVPLHEREAAFLDVLAQWLRAGATTEQDGHVAGAVVIEASCYSGIGHVLHGLAARMGPSEDELEKEPDASLDAPDPSFEGVIHVYVDSITDPETLRVKVERALVAEGGDPMEGSGRRLDELDDDEAPEAVAKRLSARRLLLVVHGASACGTLGRTFLSEVARALARRGTAPCRLAMTSWTRDLREQIASGCVRVLEFAPALEVDETVPYFELALDHYAGLRADIHALDRAARRNLGSKGAPDAALDPDAEVDGRGHDDEEQRRTDWSPAVLRRRARDCVPYKRVVHLYEGAKIHDPERLHPDFPSSIRWRALLASNPDATSPFDPTKGARRMVADALGTSARGAEAFAHVPEMSSMIGDVVSAIRRWKAAGREADLKTLRFLSSALYWSTSEMLGELRKRPETRDFAKGINLRLVTLESLVQCEYTGLLAVRARTPLLLKSVLQEDWLVFSPETRAPVHGAISAVLAEQAKKPGEGDLKRELPVEPPRGQGATALAAEAIRHAMRAARSADDVGQDKVARGHRLEARRLYQVFLDTRPFSLAPEAAEKGDGEGRSVRTARRARRLGHLPDLPRNHGLFGLKLEMLNLLSPDGQGREVPVDSDGAEGARYHTERAVCLTRMLRPLDAIEAARAGLVVSHLSATERAYITSHLIAAEIEAGDWAGAETSLADLDVLLDHLPPDVDPKPLQDRMIARRAALLGAKGRDEDLDEAVAAWNEVEEPGLVPFRSDRAVHAVDAMLKAPGMRGDRRERAWEVAERAHKAALEAGLDFEALRIDIRRAICLRDVSRAKVAEACLDHIGIDLGTFGGAEVVFHEWRLESARTVRALGKPIYGFATYAWPAYQALRDGQAKPRAEEARHLCLDLLRDARAMIASGEVEDMEPLVQNRFWDASRDADENLVDPWFSFDLHPPEKKVTALRKAIAHELGKIDALWVDLGGEDDASSNEPFSL